MTHQAHGYPIDLAYPKMFHKETAPLWIANVVGVSGQRMPRLDRPFRYLDLGCGSGFGTALLAAANPHGHFVGIDVNPRHVEQGLAYASRLSNFSVACAGFDDLAKADSPAELLDGPFDFVVANGVYSWVSSSVQANIHAIMDRYLAIGGIAYLHYTTHPGHSVFAGAQAMMRRVAAVTPGDSTAKLAGALASLRALDAAGAGYLRTHPAVSDLLLRQSGEVAMLAHDLLAPDWNALHVGDVIEDMERIGCSYVGSASVLDNVDALSVPGDCLPVLRRIGDLAARETARDIARNQSTRRDLYRKELAGLSLEDYRRQLDTMHFASSTADRKRGELKIQMAIGPISVTGEAVDPIRQRLAQGTADFAALMAQFPAGTPTLLVTHALLMLMAAGEVHPAYPISPAGQVVQPFLNEGWLAAPVLGTAIQIDPAHMAIAAVLIENGMLRGKALHDAAYARDSKLSPATTDRVENQILPFWRSVKALA